MTLTLHLTAADGATTDLVIPSPVVTPAASSSGAWISGQSEAACTADGSFAKWRGRPVEIGGAWAPADSAGNQIASPTWGGTNAATPVGAYAAIPRMDWACGGILAGESWAQAAAGAFDSRWTTLITTLRKAWGSRLAENMFVRFAHEFNGNWYPWTVKPTDVADFKAGWVRFAYLLRANFPGAKLVWCANAGSSYAYDIRTLYPGDAYVDVVGVDAYNRDEWVNTQAAFTAKVSRLTAQGGPFGIEAWRQFAASHGKPLSIPEWSSSAVNVGGGGGDAPVFIQLFHDWLVANGGTGSGQVIYEILFNIRGYGDHYEMYPTNLQPQAAAKYAQLW